MNGNSCWSNFKLVKIRLSSNSSWLDKISLSWHLRLRDSIQNWWTDFNGTKCFADTSLLIFFSSFFFLLFFFSFFFSSFDSSFLLFFRHRYDANHRPENCELAEHFAKDNHRNFDSDIDVTILKLDVHTREERELAEDRMMCLLGTKNPTGLNQSTRAYGREVYAFAQKLLHWRQKKLSHWRPYKNQFQFVNLFIFMIMVEIPPKRWTSLFNRLNWKILDIYWINIRELTFSRISRGFISASLRKNRMHETCTALFYFSITLFTSI